MQWVWHNGLFVLQGQPLFTAANRSFKWGDGLFETATFYKGRLLLAAFHFERLFEGARLLQMHSSFSEEQLTNAITDLCEKNSCSALARVRIALYRDDANAGSCVIEATALPEETAQWSETGWRVVLYPFARKSCDVFANLKSANYLPYIMAARYATETGADESLVLNTHNRICDGSKTNVFLLSGTNVYTPALSEGCVAGVMRRYVLQELKRLGYAVHQQAVTEPMVQEADCVFVTNAIEGLRWVQQFGDKTYGYGDLKKLYHELFSARYATV